MNVSEAKSEASSIAKALLAEDEGYVDRVTRMWRLGQVIYGEVWETEFHVFGVAASDVGHLPTAKVRPKYSSAALQNADKELREYIESSREAVERACVQVLEKHGST